MPEAGGGRPLDADSSAPGATLPFHPVLLMPQETVVLDLTGEGDSSSEHPWAIGRYDEVRVAHYPHPLFGGTRCLHVGIDLGGPVGVAIHAFSDGRIEHVGYNGAAGDYGHVIVTRSEVDGAPLYTLHGHLSAASSARWRSGDTFGRGDVLGWLSSRAENGGWPSHLHFQICRVRPDTHDMPGVVAPRERGAALERYPDPRLVLGRLY